MAKPTLSAQPGVSAKSTAPTDAPDRRATVETKDATRPETNAPAVVQAAQEPQAAYSIDWYVFGNGGTNGTSANYALTGTAGQTAVGPATSSSYDLYQGFWQDFGGGGCCTGRTGNVDLAGGFPTEVDSSDLGELVNYLFAPPGSVVLACVDEADVDAGGGPFPGSVDSTDLGALVSYLFSPPGTVVLPDCP